METDTKQTNTHTHTNANANRNCNAFLTGWEKQLGLNTSSETIFEQWKDEKSSKKMAKQIIYSQKKKLIEKKYKQYVYEGDLNDLKCL